MKTVQQAQFLFLFLFLSYWFTLTAQQNPQPHFRNYSTEQGLPSPEVYYAFEDSHGYMWFGTDNGATRFDGYEFKTYGAKVGLMSNVVFDIHEDGQGRIWFGTMTGEAFILEGDTVRPYEYNPLIEEFYGKFNKAGLVHLQKDETSFFELEGHGILKIDKNGHLDSIKGKLPASNLIMHFDGVKTICTISINLDAENYFLWVDSIARENIFYIDVISNNRRFQKKLPRDNEFSTLFRAHELPSGELLVFGGSYLNYSDCNVLR